MSVAPCRVLPVLRDVAAAAHQHAGVGSVQHPEWGGDGLHARNGQRALREHHAGAQVHASAHAARLPQHQHGAQHQHHSGSTGGPLLCHGQEVSLGFILVCCLVSERHLLDTCYTGLVRPSYSGSGLMICLISNAYSLQFHGHLRTLH